MNYVTKNSFVACVEEVKRLIAKSPCDLKHPKYVVVPEVYTFDFERDFYLSGGSFDVKICSFSKLYYDLVPGGKAISRQTAIALVRKIAIDKKEELEYYASAFDKRGFAAKVYETLEKLTGSNVSPEELTSSDRSLDRKLKDLRLIYGEYVAATKGDRVDANGRVAALTEYVLKENTALSGSDVFVVNFDVFTAVQKKLIEAIDKVARSVTVFSAEMQNDCALKRKPKVYAASSQEDEYSRVADYIADDVYGGMRFGQISVLGENVDYDRIKRAFDSRGIRFYFDKKQSLALSEPADLVLRVLACECDGMTADNLIALCSNRLLVPDVYLRDAFTAYVRAHNVCFSAVFEKFEKEDENAVLAEAARQKAVEVLGKGNGAEYESARAFADRFIEIIRLAESGKNERNERFFDCTKTALETLAQVFGDKPYRTKELYSAFGEIVRGTELSVVPNRTDTVFVGPLNAKRGFKCDKLYVVGFNDGVLPKTDSGSGLLCDADADKLLKSGVEISPLSRDVNARFRDELVQLVKAAEKTCFSYVSDGENKRSYMLRLIETSCGMNECDELSGDAERYSEYEPEACDISKLFPSEKSCFMRLASGDKTGAYATVLTAVGDKYEKAISANKVSGDYLSRGIEISKCSVTLLQTYFDCPKKYFYRYALGVEKTEDGKVKATDIGTLLHKIIERFVRSGNFDEPEKTGAIIAEEELSASRQYSLENNARLRRYVMRDAVTLCKKVALEFTEGEFVPMGAEVVYGDDGEDESQKLTPGGVTLYGQIDRVDRLNDCVRVIDYKSGRTVKLTANDVYYGKKLQLPVYSLAMKKKGYDPVGMFYFPINDSEESGILTGLLAKDDYFILATDKKALSQKSDVFEYDPGDKVKKSVVDRETLDGVMKYAYAVSEKAIESIKSGFIAAVPSISGQACECKYCDYKDVCPGAKAERKVTNAKYKDIIEAVKDGADD